MSDEPPTALQYPTDIIHFHLNGGDGFFFVGGDYFVEVVGWVRIDWVRSVMVCQLKSERS